MLRIQNIYDFYSSSDEMSRDELIDFIKAQVSSETKLDSKVILEETTFHQAGLDSLSSILILHNIEKETGVEINPIAFWDHPTIGGFADFVLQEQNKKYGG